MRVPTWIPQIYGCGIGVCAGVLSSTPASVVHSGCTRFCACNADMLSTDDDWEGRRENAAILHCFGSHTTIIASSINAMIATIITTTTTATAATSLVFTANHHVIRPVLPQTPWVGRATVPGSSANVNPTGEGRLSGSGPATYSSWDVVVAARHARGGGNGGAIRRLAAVRGDVWAHSISDCRFCDSQDWGASSGWTAGIWDGSAIY